jgi:signal transduction histidine kinase
VLASGRPTTFQRGLGEVEVYSVIRPLRDEDGTILGALEVAQPLTFLEAETARTRQRFLLNTLTLLLAVTVITFLLVRRFVSQPLEQFAVAVRGMGGGDLALRLDVGAAGGELAEVAQELNRMAERLEKARQDLVREGEERVTLERRLRQSERLAAMGELAAGVAHEIAAPLHVIRGRADLLLRAETDGRRASRNLGIIVQQIDRITLIVRNLLGFARRREPRAVTVDLSEVLHGVLEFLEDEISRAGVTVEWEGPAPVTAACDPDLLHQVFLNLLMNALQALEGSEEGARRIRVALRVRAANAEAAGAPTGVVEIEIEDSGPGIPSEIGERVFDPFFSTKSGSQSTGLGLAVARAIVEDHGGRMDATTPAGGGALFRVVLNARGGRRRPRGAGPCLSTSSWSKTTATSGTSWARCWRRPGTGWSPSRRRRRR